MTADIFQVPATTADDGTWKDLPQETAAHDNGYAVFTINLEGTITQANEIALQMLGYARATIIGEHYGRYLNLCHLGEDFARSSGCQDLLTHFLTGAQSFFVFGMLRGGHGHFEPVEICLTPLYAELAVTGAIVMIESLHTDGNRAH